MGGSIRPFPKTPCLLGFSRFLASAKPSAYLPKTKQKATKPSCFSLLFVAFLSESFRKPNCFSLFFVAFLCVSLLFVAFRCFSLLFIAFRCFSLLFVVFRCFSLL